MRNNTLTRWIERKLVERYSDPSHVCELCGDEDDRSVHAPLSTGEVVCWHCAERAGEFKVPLEMEWRIPLEP